MRFQGQKISVSVFGQSHAAAIGMVLEGIPAGFRPDMDRLNAFLGRRAPGKNSLSTRRRETDEPEFLSGLVEGITCGAPICAIIRNRDARSGDYQPDIPRPSHADWPALVRYGKACDLRGGGAFSGRMTAPLCIAGGIALQMLAERGIRIGAHIASVGPVQDERFDEVKLTDQDLQKVLTGVLPVISPEAGTRMAELIDQARQEGDSVGGIVECAALGLPPGWGGPLFEGLESALGAALFAIPAVKGVEIGRGFAAAGMKGSEHNDAYILKNGRIVPETNRAGGIAGGITTGMPLIFRAAFKPTPSISKPQKSVSVSQMRETKLVIQGRHDPCVVVRAVPVVEAVTALVLLDQMLSNPEGTGQADTESGN